MHRPRSRIKYRSGKVKKIIALVINQFTVIRCCFYKVAIKAFDDFDDAVIAGLWKVNKWNYDFQMLAGVAQKDIVVGGGWAGNLTNASFKGEFSYFIPTEEGQDNSFAATIGIDYSFANSDANTSANRSTCWMLL